MREGYKLILHLMGLVVMVAEHESLLHCSPRSKSQTSQVYLHNHPKQAGEETLSEQL
jgi:hypothetical protein